MAKASCSINTTCGCHVGSHACTLTEQVHEKWLVEQHGRKHKDTAEVKILRKTTPPILKLVHLKTRFTAFCDMSSVGLRGGGGGGGGGGDQDKEATDWRRGRDCRPTSWQTHNHCFTGEEKSGGAKGRQDKDEAWAVISHIQTESFTVVTAVESDLLSADDLRCQFNQKTPEKRKVPPGRFTAHPRGEALGIRLQGVHFV